MKGSTLMWWDSELKITGKFDIGADVVLYLGDTLDLLKQIPDKTAGLIVTSPPYNIGKPYEKKLNLQEYNRTTREGY